MSKARWVVAIALTMVLSTGIMGCASQGVTEPKEQEKEPIKIGAVLSLTGTYAALGTAEQQALDLELERINSTGGIGGRKLELIVEDDATDEAKAVAAATKLIDQDGVLALLGASGTGQSMAMRGDVVRAQVPQISMAGGTVITQKFEPYVFQTPWSNTIVVPFVLEAIKSAGVTRLGLITDSGGYGKDGKPIIEAQAAQLGLDIVANETFNAGDADMTTQLTKIRTAKADGVLIWTAGKEASTIMKNAQSLGMLDAPGKVPFFGGSGQARREFIDGTGEASEGFTFGTGKSLLPATWGETSENYRVVSDFAARYEAKYGRTPDIFAGHAFDAISLLEGALKAAGPEVTGPTLRDALERTDGLVGFGGVYSFSASDHNGLTVKDLALYRINQGAWEPAQ